MSYAALKVCSSTPVVKCHTLDCALELIPLNALISDDSNKLTWTNFSYLMDGHVLCST